MAEAERGAVAAVSGLAIIVPAHVPMRDRPAATANEL